MKVKNMIFVTVYGRSWNLATYALINKCGRDSLEDSKDSKRPLDVAVKNILQNIFYKIYFTIFYKIIYTKFLQRAGLTLSKVTRLELH